MKHLVYIITVKKRLGSIYISARLPGDEDNYQSKLEIGKTREDYEYKIMIMLTTHTYLPSFHNSILSWRNKKGRNQTKPNQTSTRDSNMILRRKKRYNPRFHSF